MNRGSESVRGFDAQGAWCSHVGVCRLLQDLSGRMGLGEGYCGRLHTPTCLHNDKCRDELSECWRFGPGSRRYAPGLWPVDVAKGVDWVASLDREMREQY